MFLYGTPRARNISNVPGGQSLKVLMVIAILVGRAEEVKSLENFGIRHNTICMGILIRQSNNRSFECHGGPDGNPQKNRFAFEFSQSVLVENSCQIVPEDISCRLSFALVISDDVSISFK